MARVRTLPDEEIVRRYLSGIDSLTVGLDANCDANTVLNLVRAAGHPVRRRGGTKPTAVLKIPIEEAARLYEAGASLVEVGAAAGVDHSTMNERLREFGTRIRSPQETGLLKRLQGRAMGRPKKR